MFDYEARPRQMVTFVRQQDQTVVRTGYRRLNPLPLIAFQAGLERQLLPEIEPY